MKISNLKISKKMVALTLSTSLIIAPLTACNKQVIDFNKSFNVAVETNNEIVAVIGISSYSDYEGSQIQYQTKDGLLVLTSTFQTQLIKTNSSENLEKYVNSLTNEASNISYYDELAGTSINYSDSVFNKDIFDLHFVYNKAIILSGNTALIAEIETWKDYEDDKIQIKFKDGTCILCEPNKVKLVNDESAKDNSIFNYATALVGNKDNVNIYDSEEVKNVK